MKILINKFKVSLKEYGILNTLKKICLAIIRNLIIIIKLYSYKITRNKKFIFNSIELNYFYHFYNKTYENERIIEIPILLELLSKYKINNYYELGNVLINYGIKGHPVIDKYDNSENIIKEDIVTFKPLKKLNNLVSISTLEHIGWDEGEKNYSKVSKAFHNILDSLLLPGGIFIFTFPVGYNPHLDEYIKINKDKFYKIYPFIRINIKNTWVETDFETCMNQKFNHPYINANGLIVGIAMSS
jgi:hypothetical protein